MTRTSEPGTVAEGAGGMTAKEPASDAAGNLKVLGRLAKVHGIQRGTWVSKAEASRVSGVAGYSLKDWVSTGLLTFRQQGPGAHRMYLREEMDELRKLERHGCPPSLWIVRRHVERREAPIGETK